VQLRFRGTQEEMDAFERAARYSGLALSAWLRITMREAAERETNGTISG
jgi:hypothetical protein